MNPHLTALDLVVVVLNIALAAWAARRNAQAWRGGYPAQRVIRGVIAVLAVAYVAAYAVLAFTRVDIAAWSSVMRGVSLVAWWVVWTAPATNSVRSWRHLTTAVTAEAERRQAEAGDG